MRLYYQDQLTSLYHGDCRYIPLPDSLVHCVVTSPPYYGLRKYKDVDDRVLGLESTPELYVEHMVEVFREVKRVLRDDGVCFINLGDSYSSGTGGDRKIGVNDETRAMARDTIGVPGNQLLIPHRVALALQADGWILRDTIIWAKPAPMPESLAGWRWQRCRVKVGESDQPRQDVGVRKGGNNGTWPEMAKYIDCTGCPKCADNDGLVLRRGSWRCTSSHEYILMLVKQMNYYSDGEAVKTGSLSDHPSGNGFKRDARVTYQNADGSARGKDAQWEVTPTANRRSVWRDIKPEPYKGQHYATFPSDLPRLCIQASTSDKGCCPGCGSQWARVVERTFTGEFNNKEAALQRERNIISGGPDGVTLGRTKDISVTTLDWRPTCSCNLPNPTPSIVLDPFAGTATTCRAARNLNRFSIGIDLSLDYLNQALIRMGLTNESATTTT